MPSSQWAIYYLYIYNQWHDNSIIINIILCFKNRSVITDGGYYNNIGTQVAWLCSECYLYYYYPSNLFYLKAAQAIILGYQYNIHIVILNIIWISYQTHVIDSIHTDPHERNESSNSKYLTCLWFRNRRVYLII